MNNEVSSDQGAFEGQLRAAVRGEVYFDDVTRGLYATDASMYQITPVCVVMPRDEADVLAAMSTARAHGVAILPRGAGTSLGGQAVGAAMVMDMSRYMNRIIEVDLERRTVRVQSGIVLDELNAALAPHGLLFAPDPATSSRATIGGMIGNNSSGTKSIIYGITRDHVLETKVALSDGSVMQFGPLSDDQCDSLCAAGDGRQAEILGEFRRIIADNREQIARRYPKTMRRVQGYNLDAYGENDDWNLSRLIVGSEGTLGVALEATLNLEPVPKCKILCVVHFAELIEAIRAVVPIVAHGPSAVEILDADVVKMARGNLSVAPLCGFLEGDPAAVLIVEFFADTPDEAERKASAFAAAMESGKTGYAWPVIANPAGQANVWSVRKNGLGLMLGINDRRKPTAFIEDCCVPIDVLPEYIDRILAFCKQRGVPAAMYAHASVGVIHIRPLLDLKTAEDIENMKAIAEKTFELVTHYGGAWSGEHGDGRVRSPFLERYFGERIYGAFRQVKRLFDPAGLMNPGVIVDPGPMDRDLRYGTKYVTPQADTEFHFRRFGSFAGAVEQCSGVGACRQTLVGTMCPSYRATLDEKHCPRGRANTLRLAMTGQLGSDGAGDDAVAEAMELCLSCKACKSECPSNVDVARLKSQHLQARHDAHGAPFREKLVAATAGRSKRLAGWKAPIVNWAQNAPGIRHVIAKATGMDARRKLPTYARVPFGKWFDRRPSPDGPADKKVVLFDDTYINYHQVEVGMSAVELLESCGYSVVPARAGCCQRIRISHGFLRDARAEGEETLRNLDALISQGLTVVCCEPSCASALTDDLPDLIGDEALGERIRQGVMMIDVFLAGEIAKGNLACAFTSPFDSVLVHGHCHQKSLYGTTHMTELLKRADGVRVEEINSGCCGMAGSFGYEAEHYDLSMAIGEQALFPAIRSRPAGAAVVACGFSCRHQIADATGVKALHWVQTIRGRNGEQT